MASDKPSASSGTNNEQLFIGVCRQPNQYQQEDSVTGGPWATRSELFRTSERFQTDLTDLRLAVESLREGMQSVKEQVLPISRSLPNDMLSSTQGGLDELRIICDRHEKAMLQEKLHMKELNERIDKMEQERRVRAQMPLPEPDDKVDTLTVDVTILMQQQQQLNDQVAQLFEQQRQFDEQLNSQTKMPPSLDSKTAASSPEVAAVAEESKDIVEGSYELKDSLWDYSLIIGLPETGSLASVYLMVLLVVNTILQLALSFIINDTFTEPELSEKQIPYVKHWRLHYAHSPDLMNRFTHQPFVKDVCEFNPALYMDTPVAATLSLVEQYTPRHWNKESVVGPFMQHFMPDIGDIGMLLSLIATLIWSMNVVGSLQGIRDSTWAFYRIPRAEKTEIAHGPNSNAFVAVTRCRQVFYGLVLLLQFGVVVILGIAGVWYIIRTIFLRDLLLNCSALAIVMDIDEYMAVLVPCQAKDFLASLEPLTRPKSKGFKGINQAAVVKAGFVISIMAGALFALESQLQVLEDIREEICGGNLEFIAGVDKAGVVNAAPPPVSNGWETTTYYEDALNQLVHNSSSVMGGFNKNDLSSVSTSIEGGVWSLVGWLGASDAEILNYWNSYCVDMIPVEGSAYEYADHFLRLLRESVGNPSIHECTEVVQYCGRDDFSGIRTRQICPTTCGCADPGSSLILVDSSGGGIGCPPICRTTSTYKEAMQAQECKDSGLESSYWSNYARGLQDFILSYQDSVPDELLSMLRSYGCGLASTGVAFWGYYWPDPCETWDTLRIKSIIYACPITCGCNTNFRPGCPETCRPPLS